MSITQNPDLALTIQALKQVPMVSFYQPELPHAIIAMHAIAREGKARAYHGTNGRIVRISLSAIDRERWSRLLEDAQDIWIIYKTQG